MSMTPKNAHRIADSLRISFGMVRDLERDGSLWRGEISGNVGITVLGLARIAKVTQRKAKRLAWAEERQDRLNSEVGRAYQHMHELRDFIAAIAFNVEPHETYRRRMLAKVKEWCRGL